MLIIINIYGIVPIPVVAGSKAGVWGLSLAGIVGSHPAGAWMSVRVSVVCCQVKRSLGRADHSSRGVLPSVACLCDLESSIMRKPWPTRGVKPLEGGGV
jgi:hypothetical protein